MPILAQDSPTGWGVLGITIQVKGRIRGKYSQIEIIKPQVTQENLTASTGPSTLSGMPVLGQADITGHCRSHISPQVRGKVRVK